MLLLSFVYIVYRLMYHLVQGYIIMLYISPPLAPKVNYIVTDTLNGVDNCSQMLCVRLDSLYKGKVID